MNVRMREILCLLSLLPFQALAANVQKVPSVEFDASAWTDVDASGAAHVELVERVSKFGDSPHFARAAMQIKDMLKQRIESWQFIPATLHGAVVPSRTYVTVRLEGIDDGKGGLGIRIVSASTGSAARNMQPPRYPMQAVRAGKEGRVMLVVDYGEDGKVVAVKVEESKAIHDGKLEDRRNSMFDDAAVNAARSWSFQNELVAGRPKAGRNRIPVTFCLTAACQRLPQVEPDMPRDGELVAIDPAVKLRSAVAGTAL